MFIHWGPVTLKGTEISMSRGVEVPISEYDSLYMKFNPVNFNADEWVSVAKSAGMKYMVLVAKHPDGFCLWNTRQTDYNIMHSPFKRDVVKELSEACKKQGIRFGTYYSTPDWHNPDFPKTGPKGTVTREKSDLDAYTRYLKRQIAELLLNYGPLEVLWFDVPQLFDVKRGQGVIDFARTIQPDILINDRTRAKGPKRQVRMLVVWKLA
jgi:alpha-L-fucosidase